MGLKIDKGLFEERAYGGFEYTDPDDETFLLDQLEKYPGDLPFENENLEVEDNFLASISDTGANEKVSVEEITPSNFASEVAKQQEGEVPQDDTSKQQNVSFENEERLARPYEKAGIDKEEKKRVPYQKSGLIEDEEVVPFERSGLEPKAEPKIAEVSKSTKSIWDIFEDVESENVTSETTERNQTVLEPKPEQIQAQDEEQLIKEPPTEETEKAEDIKTDLASTPQTETILIESDSIVGIPIEIKVSKVSQEELEAVLDKDFRNSLLEDLEKSRKKREQKEAKQEEVISAEEKEILQAELNEESSVPTVEEVTPVEVDISSIELEKPSQIVAQEFIETGELDKKKKKKKKKVKFAKEKEQVQTENAKEVVVGFEKTEEELKSGETQEAEEEKRKRKAPVFWLVLGGGLVLLLFVVGGGYLVYRNYFVKQQPKKEIAKKPEPLKKAEQKAEIAKPETTASNQTGEGEIPAPSKQENEAKEDLSKIESKAITPVESKFGAKESKVKPKSEPQTKPTVPKYISKQESKPFVLPKEVRIVETTQEEYSIEIFSTADPEEANYWIAQLQKRGINVYQKVHKVKNVPYYKIRIGSYKSLEEARDFARNLGFRNFWIDRIK